MIYHFSLIILILLLAIVNLIHFFMNQRTDLLQKLCDETKKQLELTSQKIELIKQDNNNLKEIISLKQEKYDKTKFLYDKITEEQV